jgi:hypothetical protein
MWQPSPKPVPHLVQPWTSYRTNRTASYFIGVGRTKRKSTYTVNSVQEKTSSEIGLGGHFGSPKKDLARSTEHS